MPQLAERLEKAWKDGGMEGRKEGRKGGRKGKEGETKGEKEKERQLAKTFNSSRETIHIAIRRL